MHFSNAEIASIELRKSRDRTNERMARLSTSPGEVTKREPEARKNERMACLSTSPVEVTKREPEARKNKGVARLSTSPGEVDSLARSKNCEKERLDRSNHVPYCPAMMVGACRSFDRHALRQAR